MAEEEGGGGWSSDMVIVVVALLLIVLGWFYGGAKHRLPLSTIFTTPSPFSHASSTSPFRSPFAPFYIPQTPQIPADDSGQTDYSNLQDDPYASYNSGISFVPNNTYSQNGGYRPSSYVPTYNSYTGSPYQNAVTITEVAGAAASDPQREYIVLQASPQNGGPIVITGWTLVSETYGKRATIGGGVDVPVGGATEGQGPISLNPGDRAIVETGRSPIGASFRENVCTGYIAKFQTMTPVPAMNCPSVVSDLGKGTSLGGDGSCVAAALQVSACTTVTSATPNVSAACSAFLEQHATYNGCVGTHSFDYNFAQPTWRIFLGQPRELWNNSHDYIQLLDQAGNLVSATSY